ncbi:MAG TPA: patatin-like phospholipase family protein [Candidatus Binatia bacterium]|jgi:NTE family protein|nr:patatin-like phospholipase family protein [Candidatus Binatia bacterium]
MRRRRSLAVVFFALTLAVLPSCTWRSVSNSMPWSGSRPKVALVLSGGVARGFAHVGVIRVLERHKIPIDIIVGVDTGSLVAAVYADRKNASELERVALALEERDIFDYNFINPTQGFARGERLEAFLARSLATQEIERLRMPFAAVAADLETGAAVALKSGSIARAVRASNALPGIFSPVTHQGKLLADGCVADNMPVDVARALGADLVIAVDVLDGKPAAQPNNIFETLVQSTFLMARHSAGGKLKSADFVIRPKLESAGLMDFSRKKELVALGMAAAEEAVPALRARIGIK